MSDERLISDLLSDKDILIPLAALVGAPLCDRDRTGAQTTNPEAVRLLCKLSSPNQLILFPVTNSGYGIGQAGISCTEDSPLRPISLYGETKVKAERIVLIVATPSRYDWRRCLAHSLACGWISWSTTSYGVLSRTTHSWYSKATASAITSIFKTWQECLSMP